MKTYTKSLVHFCWDFKVSGYATVDELFLSCSSVTTTDVEVDNDRGLLFNKCCRSNCILQIYDGNYSVLQRVFNIINSLE